MITNVIWYLESHYKKIGSILYTRTRQRVLACQIVLARFGIIFRTRKYLHDIEQKFLALDKTDNKIIIR